MYLHLKLYVLDIGLWLLLMSLEFAIGYYCCAVLLWARVELGSTVT